MKSTRSTFIIKRIRPSDQVNSAISEVGGERAPQQSMYLASPQSSQGHASGVRPHPWHPWAGNKQGSAQQSPLALCQWAGGPWRMAPELEGTALPHTTLWYFPRSPSGMGDGHFPSVQPPGQGHTSLTAAAWSHPLRLTDRSSTPHNLKRWRG